MAVGAEQPHLLLQELEDRPLPHVDPPWPTAPSPMQAKAQNRISRQWHRLLGCNGLPRIVTSPRVVTSTGTCWHAFMNTVLLAKPAYVITC